MRTFYKLIQASLIFGITAITAQAADLKLEARLIWGANDDKDTVKYKQVDPGLSENLHRMFKWKNYVEITNQSASIPAGQSSDLSMSQRCTIRVKNLGNSQVEVNCIGQGKEVYKGVYTLISPQWVVLGGNDKNNTAWFIGLRSVDDKPTITKN